MTFPLFPLNTFQLSLDRFKTHNKAQPHVESGLFVQVYECLLVAYALAPFQYRKPISPTNPVPNNSMVEGSGMTPIGVKLNSVFFPHRHLAFEYRIALGFKAFECGQA